MDALFLAARLLLAGVFVIAGVAKLLDPAGSRRSLIDFGVTPSLASLFSTALPLVELGVAVALIPTASAGYGALGALALLLTFTLTIAVNLARGRQPDCHCFGQVYSEPVGTRALVRNLALSGVAAFLALAGWSDPGPSVIAWLYPLAVAERATIIGGAVGLVLLLVQSALLVTVIRQNRQLLQRLTVPSVASTSAPETAVHVPIAPQPFTLPREVGLPFGTPAPHFALDSLDGETLTLDMLRESGKPLVLLFSDPNCGPCTAFLPEVAHWQRAHADALTVAVVSRGTPEDNRTKIGDVPLTRVLLQRDREVADAFGVLGTPTALVIRPDGTVGSLLAQAEVEIRQLVARWAPPPDSNHPAPMEAAPAFSLPNLDGEMVTLAQHRGKPTLALFWNPGCVYCQRMLRDLKTWEAKSLADRAQLLVISVGSVDDNRAQGLRSTVVLDPGFTVLKQYGGLGTPSAILIDADGRLAGPLAVGNSAVLALAGQPESPAEEGLSPNSTLTLSGGRVPPTTLPPDAKPMRHDCVQDELLPDGSIILYNGCQRQLLTLNGTAALVWDLCDGDHAMEGIIAEVREVFPEAPEADRDVRELVDSLLQGSMIKVGEVTPVADSAVATTA